MIRDEIIEYIHLPTGSALPETTIIPRRIIVLVEQEVSSKWQDEVSGWIIDSGCLYMMAWGTKCSEWDDSVDWANRERYRDEKGEYLEIPDDRFVMTTWHAEDDLAELFFYSISCAHDPWNDLELVTILHISGVSKEDEIIKLYQEVQENFWIEGYITQELTLSAQPATFVKRALSWVGKWAGRG